MYTISIGVAGRVGETAARWPLSERTSAVWPPLASRCGVPDGHRPACAPAGLTAPQGRAAVSRHPSCLPVSR